MKKIIRRGFTLVELLVVVAILLILMGLLLPSLMGAYEMAARAKCLSNLRQVTLSYTMLVQDQTIGAGPQIAGIRSYAHVFLLPGLSYSTKVFKCPSDRKPHWAGVAAYWQVHASAGSPPCDGGSLPFLGGFEQGPWGIPYELSNPTTYVSGATTYSNHSILTSNLTSDTYQRLWFDDGFMSPTDVPDLNYRDCNASFQDLGNGTTRFCFQHGTGSSYCYQIFRADNSILATNLTCGNSCTPICFDLKEGIKSGYALNAMLHKFTVKKVKVMGLDYTKPVVSVPLMNTQLYWGCPLDTPPRFDDYMYNYFVGNTASASEMDYWPTNSAPRHIHRTNVAFTDGHVETMYPDQIDPDLMANYTQYWAP